VEVHFEESGFGYSASPGVGLAELATLPVAAAIGNAVHHATGWRPRDLPLHPRRVMAGVRR
jgi:xanthine dehydrogenase YagR molybdenum-binding subunit